MPTESSYTGRLFWTAEIEFVDDTSCIKEVSRMDIKDYIQTAPVDIRAAKDIDIVNKYVIPYVEDLVISWKKVAKSITVRKDMRI